MSSTKDRMGDVTILSDPPPTTSKTYWSKLKTFYDGKKVINTSTCYR